MSVTCLSGGLYHVVIYSIGVSFMLLPGGKNDKNTFLLMVLDASTNNTDGEKNQLKFRYVICVSDLNGI